MRMVQSGNNNRADAPRGGVTTNPQTQRRTRDLPEIGHKLRAAISAKDADQLREIMMRVGCRNDVRVKVYPLLTNVLPQDSTGDFVKTLLQQRYANNLLYAEALNLCAQEEGAASEEGASSPSSLPYAQRTTMLSPEQGKVAKEEGHCYYCGSASHFLRECGKNFESKSNRLKQQKLVLSILVEQSLQEKFGVRPAQQRTAECERDPLKESEREPALPTSASSSELDQKKKNDNAPSSPVKEEVQVKEKMLQNASFSSFMSTSFEVPCEALLAQRTLSGSLEVHLSSFPGQIQPSSSIIAVQPEVQLWLFAMCFRMQEAVPDPYLASAVIHKVVGSLSAQGWEERVVRECDTVSVAVAGGLRGTPVWDHVASLLPEMWPTLEEALACLLRPILGSLVCLCTEKAMIGNDISLRLWDSILWQADPLRSAGRFVAELLQGLQSKAPLCTQWEDLVQAMYECLAEFDKCADEQQRRVLARCCETDITRASA